MTNTWALCALWVGLALAATLLAIWFKVSTALSEIVVGTVAQLVIGVFLTGLFGFAQGGLAGNTQWITFLAGTGAIVLTFLAGAELDPAIFKTKWREASIIGLAGFFGPFLGCTAIAHAQLALRCCSFNNVRRRCVRSDVGTWFQRHGIRQSDSCRLLHQ
jgi:Kef-type K+ transport system membrane component KefB